MKSILTIKIQYTNDNSRMFWKGVCEENNFKFIHEISNNLQIQVYEEDKLVFKNSNKNLVMDFIKTKYKLLSEHTLTTSKNYRFPKIDGTYYTGKIFKPNRVQSVMDPVHIETKYIQ